ncbi:MAG: CBS domain-containing protein [Balneolaceae bacterium]|nr:CBS domain-containing protein [Balneolaceae bacterium]
MKVKEVLSHKGSDIYSIRSDETVYDAIKLMSELNIGALLVIDDGKFVGIISERDYRDKVILKGRQSKSTPVKDIMTDKVFCVSYDDDVQMCMRIMTQRKIRHLPVLKDEDLAGLISIGDVVKSVIDEQKHEIESLREFIGGSYPA